MINLEALASAINSLLGTDKFLVYLNSNAYPDDIGERNVVTMNVLRVPFGFSTDEFDAESLQITLTFDLPCDVFGEDVVVRDSALETIQAALLGRRKFEVCQGSYDQPERYLVNTFFEQQPAGNPYADNGRVTQQIILSGKALVQNQDCLAVVGNDIKVSLGKNKDDYTQLLKVTRVSSTQIGTDNNLALSQGETRPEVYAISQTSTKVLTFLYTGKSIEDELLKIAEGMPFDINKVYYYRAVYPSYTIEYPFKIISVSSEDTTGVYLQYTLTIQVVGEMMEV